MSLLEVEEVAATAAGIAGLRGGAVAARGRAAGGASGVTVEMVGFRLSFGRSALDDSALDVSALDVSVLDVSVLDVSVLDASTLDFSALAASLLSPAAALGPRLRAAGRGFGSGTFAVAQASPAIRPDNATARDRPVATSGDRAVERNARARSKGITLVLRGESAQSLSGWSGNSLHFRGLSIRETFQNGNHTEI